LNTHPDLPAAGQTISLLLPGAAGNIEVLLSMPRESVHGVAVICHPHPLFGGAMSNKVVYTLATCAQKAGLLALRFNFRGVGRSEGQHDAGVGETDDVLALVQWLHERVPDVPLVLMGFSFGAFVSLRAAPQARPALQVSIAPPFSKYVNQPAPPHPNCPWLVLHSTDDDVVEYNDTVKILQTFVPPPELVTLEGAGHFFHGRLGDIEQAVLPFLQKNLTA
jgi:alpha/beta superfamily hydrolase